MTNDGNTTLQKGGLGTLECVMILVGGMVGSAIFSLSGLTYTQAGPAAIISWIIGAVILLMYGLQVAELTAIYPHSGGIFVYPYEALGKSKKSKKAWGWFAAWSLLNVNIFGAAFAAIYVAQYLGTCFPALGNYIVPIAIIFCLICTLLNVFNISVMGKANVIMVIVLIVTMLIYTFAGLTAFNPENFTPFFGQGTMGTTGFISAIPTAMLAYGAIISVALMVSQVRNPKKTVPKSMFISMAVTVALYVIVLVGTIGMITVEFLAQNPGMQYIPLYAAAWTVLPHLTWLPYLITIAAIMALATTALVLTNAAGWTIMAVAESGVLPKGLAKINPKTGTPVRAILIAMAATLVLSCFPQFTEQIVNIGAMCSAIAAIIVAITVLAARKKTTYIEGNFRVAGGPVIPILSIILVALFIIPGVFQPWSYWGLTLLWYVAGLVILLISYAANKGSDIQNKAA